MQECIKYRCGRLKKPNIVLSWVKETIYYKGIIVAKRLTYVCNWIDTACAVHSDMISYNGGAISMGNGVLHEKLLVQRLDTKISTEAEKFHVSEYLPYNLWLMIFCICSDME